MHIQHCIGNYTYDINSISGNANTSKVMLIQIAITIHVVQTNDDAILINTIVVTIIFMAVLLVLMF